jgi:hypothetical protein
MPGDLKKDSISKISKGELNSGLGCTVYKFNFLVVSSLIFKAFISELSHFRDICGVCGATMYLWVPKKERGLHLLLNLL